jgi:hypothetical protein
MKKKPADLENLATQAREALRPPQRDLVEWRGSGGTYTAPQSVAHELAAAFDREDDALLSPELVAHLDRIMDVMQPEGGAS